MKKILLIQPPIRDYYRTAKRTIPYGLAAIAGSLRSAGFGVEILDALATDRSRILSPPEELAYLSPFYGKPDISPFALFHRFSHYGYSYEHLEKSIRRSNAFVVGISSLFTAYAEEAMETAKVARKALPKAVIVVGGHHATAFPEAVLSTSAVDFVIRGEGEEAMTEFTKALSGCHPMEDIPGVARRTTAGRFHINPPAVVSDLDRLPHPAMDLIRHDHYRRVKRSCTVVMTSRGCPMSCTYCCMGKDSPYPYRKRDPASVLSEIETAVYHHDAAFIDFEDENLALDREGFRSILKGIRERFQGRELELRAMNGLYPPSLNTKILEEMRAAGFTALNLALGTTDPDQLKRFRRPDVRREFERVVHDGHRLGLSIVAYVIAGSPGQDPLSTVTDLIYLSQLPVVAGLSVFYPAPSSVMHDTCNNMKILPKRPGLYRSSAIPVTDTTTRLQSITLMRISRMINFMKRMVSGKIAIPNPETLRQALIDPDMGSVNLGVKLISAFLADGLIRGVLPDGTLYLHQTDDEVTARFIAGCSPQRVSASA